MQGGLGILQLGVPLSALAVRSHLLALHRQQDGPALLQGCVRQCIVEAPTTFLRRFPQDPLRASRHSLCSLRGPWAAAEHVLA
eukprot:13818156-Alexandrium_andersonii.AAC.1